MKRYTFFILTAMLSLALFAQTAHPDTATITRQITIEREYTPTIRAAGKINTLPFFIEHRVERRTPQFNTDFSQPLTVERSIHQLASAELIKTRPRQPEGFARIGAGTGFNTLADLMLPLVRQPNTRLDFILNHDAFHNSQAFATTQAALLFNQRIGNGLNFHAGLSGGHQYIRYYGDIFGWNNEVLDFRELPENTYFWSINPTRPQVSFNWNDLSQSNNFWRVNANVGLGTSPAAQDLRWGVNVDYNLFNMHALLNEQIIALSANFSHELGEGRLGLDLVSTNLFYTTTELQKRLFGNEITRWSSFSAVENEEVFKNFSVLSLNPYYSLQGENFDLRLGANLASSFHRGRNFTLTPDVRFDWRAIPRTLAFYAGISGDYQINSLNAMYLINPYLNPNVSVASTYTPWDFLAGALFSPMSGLLIDVFANYRFINNQFFFANQNLLYFPPWGGGPLPGEEIDEHEICRCFWGMDAFSNRFDVVYNAANHFRVGGRISYSLHDRFNAQLSLAYNHWSVRDDRAFTPLYQASMPPMRAWHKPTFELDFNANLRITERLNVFTALNIETGRYAPLNGYWEYDSNIFYPWSVVEMQPIINLQLGASYAVQNWMSVFVRANNILNRDNQIWHGYNAQRFNLMAGAAFNF